jgi:hypothetical protein
MVACPKCGYRWVCRSELETICCPSCHRKFPRPPLRFAYTIPLIDILPVGDTCDVCGGTTDEVHICRTVDGGTMVLCGDCLARLTA